MVLSRIFSNDEVHVEITYGDITSDINVNAQNIVKAISEKVKRYAQSNHLKQSNFKQVIHILDTAIVEDIEASKLQYSLTNIYASKPEQVLSRNHRKQSNVNKISSIAKVWVSVPYQAYYMSRNLDHALYGKIGNSTDDEKDHDAHAFSKKYKDNLDAFSTFIKSSSFSRMDGYKESWDFIKKDLHSLERYTNLGLCLLNAMR